MRTPVVDQVLTASPEILFPESDPILENAISAGIAGIINHCLQSHAPDKHFRLLAGYIEKYGETISVETLALLLEIRPDLMCDEIADMLIFELNKPAIDCLKEKGWIMTEEFKELIESSYSDILADDLDGGPEYVASLGEMLE